MARFLTGFYFSSDTFKLGRLSIINKNNTDFFSSVGWFSFRSEDSGNYNSITGRLKGNLGHYYFALSVFLENMGHPHSIKILIIKKCPK